MELEIVDFVDQKEFELKSGYWQVAIDELDNGKFRVEMYWRTYYMGKKEYECYCSPIIDDEKEARALFDAITSPAVGKKLLEREPDERSCHP